MLFARSEFTRSLGLAAGLAVATAAAAQVETYTGSQIIHELGFANFDTLKYPDPLLNYMEGGLTVSMDHIAFELLQIDGTAPYYPNAGDTEMIVITRTDGLPFEALEFQVWNGWATDPSYVWAQAFMGGVLAAEFDIDQPGPSQGFPVLGFKGRFDELRIAAYFDAATRNQHDPAGYQAAALDNMRFGAIEGGEECYPDCNGDTVLDFFDFLCYLNAFDNQEEYADCEVNGVFDFFDFLCYLNAFDAGC